MKKLIGITLLLCIVTTGYSQVTKDKYVKAPIEKDYLVHSADAFNFESHLGKRINQCIKNSIKSEDLEHLIEPFRHRNETRWWQTEFWGKWMLSAAKAYEYTQDPEIFEMMESSTKKIMATQSDNGYIGNYAPGHHLKQWDIWGRKYTMLGLLYFYDLTGNEKVLNSARRLANHLMTEIGPGKANIVLTGNYRGMASSSILEPIVMLYERTGTEKYLGFAKYIVSQWNTEKGPMLIRKALNEIPVSERFTDFGRWWSWGNGQKAYEMMSCYDGLLRLYRVTGKEQYLQAVQNTVENIRKEEINIVGSGASMECWFKGKKHQTYPAEHTMETCVTVYWMKLCYELFRYTGNWKLVEEIEKSAYNNILGSLMPDGHRFCKYSALQGYRDEDGYQCNMKTNCCMANGPRGLVLLPDLAVMQNKNNFQVNLYNSGTAKATLPGNKKVELQFQTSYPKKGKVTIKVIPDQEDEFGLKLRIPSWSSATNLQINGRKLRREIVPGSYTTITRKWNKGDNLEIHFEMKGKIVEQTNEFRTYQAIVRGPIVLARDSRFGDYGVDTELTHFYEAGETIPLKPMPSDKVWMKFMTELEYGAGENPVKIEVPVVNFSSAGNQWSPQNRYRVWMPVIYDPQTH